jgi:hypothetical protein
LIKKLYRKTTVDCGQQFPHLFSSPAAAQVVEKKSSLPFLTALEGALAKKIEYK